MFWFPSQHAHSRSDDGHAEFTRAESIVLDPLYFGCSDLDVVGGSDDCNSDSDIFSRSFTAEQLAGRNGLSSRGFYRALSGNANFAPDVIFNPKGSGNGY